ncbi:LOW QUALITY PROTEIN: hypothetical protein V2J09_018323 [Rumex salicifolius]
MFAITCWWAWKWRNHVIFEELEAKPHTKQTIVEQLIGFRDARNRMNIEGRRRIRVMKMIREVGCELDINGAARGNLGPATAGGVFRDANGSWLWGFAANLGHCSAPVAELWGTIHGLGIAWDRGFRHFLSMDSETLVKALQNGIPNIHILALLVVMHSLRESNPRLYEFSSPPFDLSEFPVEDARGTGIPRVVTSFN